MRALLLSFVILLVAGCTQEEPIYQERSYVFGTLVDVVIYGEQETAAKAMVSQISRDFQTLHNRLHAWRQSEVKAINNAFTRGKVPVKIAPDIADMIDEMTTLSVQSQGAFNPAIGKLIALWGFHQDEIKPIKLDSDRISALVAANPHMVDIVIENGKVISTNPAVQLDFGGYAKGYALDQALKMLRRNGVKHALINIGGNIIALGKHGDRPWRVGIQHPRKPGTMATLDLPSGWAIGTSGDYQRYFEQDGKRYCHIINPATGYPVQGVQSVTVLIPPQVNAGVLSDVASKPIFIADAAHRVAAARSMQVDNYLIIESDKKIIASAEMAKRLTWAEKDSTKNLDIIPNAK